MKKERDYDQDLHNLRKAFADFMLDADEEEVLEATGARGKDPAAVAKHFGKLILRAEAAVHSERVNAAREQHQILTAQLRQAEARMPATPVERRSLLETLLAKPSDLRNALMVAYRDFSKLSDGDVESLLRQVLALTTSDDGDDRKPEGEP